MAFPSDYTYKVPLTTDSSQVASNESNFPYYFDLANISDSQFWNNVQSDGGDLRVSTNSDGSNQIPLEVAAIDTASQTGEIHFKDSTDSASNKTYYLWWEDTTGAVSQPAATDPNGRNAVWSRYLAVYHLNETSGSTAVDSTGSNDGTYQGNLPTPVDGLLTNAQHIQGTSDYVSVPSIDTGGKGWVQNIFHFDSLGTPRAFNKDWIFQDGGLSVEDNGNNQDEFYWRYGGGNACFKVSQGTYVDGNCHLKHVRVDDASSPDDLDWYLDGQQEPDTANDRGGSAETILEAIGPGGNPWDGSNGYLEECRVVSASNPLNANWITTESNVLQSNASFWTVGTVEQTGGTTFTKTTSESATATDDTAITAGLSIGEDATASDTTTADASFTRSFTNTVNTSDTFTASRVLTALANETASVSDSSSVTVSYTRDTSETASVSDTFSNTVDYTRTVTETSSTADSIQRDVSYTRNVNETATSSDTYTQNRTITFSTSEQVSVTDITDFTVTFTETVLESVTVADDETRDTNYTRTISETTTTSDSLSRDASFTRTFQNTISANDTFTRTISFTRQTNESVSTTDSANAKLLEQLSLWGAQVIILTEDL